MHDCAATERVTTQRCIIFDLDGTLVDSEGLCNQAFLDLLPDLDTPLASLVAMHRGRKLAEILADLSSALGRALPADFETRYRAHVAARFSEALHPMPGVREMLRQLRDARCVASSGPSAKIRQALSVSGLSSYFGEHVFSAYEVGSWKPDPGLFLHAADAMGFAPSCCVVVEDSEAGVLAARAAGMDVVHLAPADSEPLKLGEWRIGHMSELIALLETRAVRPRPEA
ncbi:HAD family hydrolase [Niveibacterium umoris]|uniref:HAD superfamily hydrolase (TIGR01509 family) n=1 Tax=Niveibacterium umoris TaxID=1193620 RepID=A0A840BJ25_9RHOO|nr:HAD-IA family hydrolase [Niveibacterium umoris]MBB4013235.1 HAD superfamily hydrolase (TIGR01509 family) [Niveibacterium umoris]